MKRRLVAIAAALLMLALSTLAHADLLDTEMLIDVVHSGAPASDVSGLHTYGRAESFFTDFGQELIVSSPAGATGFDNAISLDFSDFAYGDTFAGSLGQITISQIAEDVAANSVAVFAGTTEITVSAITTGNSLTASWSADDVLNVTPGNAHITIAWNSVPAPGSIALLGMAGLATKRRRQRAG